MNNKERCLQLHVNSVANNPANIMSGEPYYLGFDFFIKKDDINEMIKFVSLVLNELDVPLINMTILGEKDLNNDDILTKKEDTGTSGSTSTSSSTSSSDGQKIVDYALNFVGNPYVWGGGSLTSGCDCSHFVYLVLKDVGAYNGGYTTSSNWNKLGTKVDGGLSNAQAGDVVVYSGHVGIYDGKGKLVEAKGRKWGITNDRSPQSCSHQLLGVRRFV